MSVAPDSPAAKSGFRAGDRIVSMEGQPILSIADVQFVLHEAGEEASLKVEVDRAGAKTALTLSLKPGWRRAGDFAWRTLTWGLRHKLLGVEPLQAMSAADRETAGLKDGEMALQMRKLPPGWVKEKNPGGAQFKPGDAIVEVDGRRDLLREDDLFAYLLSKKPGAKVEVVVLRGGAREKLPFTLP
jgi:S1-C subfamily serine protease